MARRSVPPAKATWDFKCYVRRHSNRLLVSERASKTDSLKVPCCLTSGGSLAGDEGSFFRGVSFGSGVTYAGGTSFLLQPGIYLVHLSADEILLNADGGATLVVQMVLNGSPFLANKWIAETFVATQPGFATFAGDELVQVTALNTTVEFTVTLLSNAPVSLARLGNGCRIIFTRLQ
jgi:hypothetical protein